MLTVNSAWFVKDLLDYENRVLWFGSEKIDELEFKEDQPFLVDLLHK